MHCTKDFDQYEYQKSDNYWDYQSLSGSHDDYYYEDNWYSYQYDCDYIQREPKNQINEQMSFKSKPQEISESSSEALYLDNLEITDARDILDLETPIKTDKDSQYDNDIDFHDSLWQQFNGQSAEQSADQTSGQPSGQSCEPFASREQSDQQEIDSTQTEDYIVTCLDDLQPIDREGQQSQQLAYSLDEWQDYQSLDHSQPSIFNANATDIVFDGSQPIPESDFPTFSDNC